MGLLNFGYQKSVNAVESKEQLIFKITEAMQKNGIVVNSGNDEITASGLKSYFNTGDVAIKVEDTSIKVDGCVKPSISAIICIVISLIFDFIGLFGECELEEVLCMALVIALGAAGTIGCIITFLFGKELLSQKIALIINSVDK